MAYINFHFTPRFGNDFNIGGLFGDPNAFGGLDPGSTFSTIPVSPQSAGFTNVSGATYTIQLDTGYENEFYRTEPLLEPVDSPPQTISYNTSVSYSFTVPRFPIFDGKIFESGLYSGCSNDIYVTITQRNASGSVLAVRYGWAQAIVRGIFTGDMPSDFFGSITGEFADLELNASVLVASSTGDIRGPGPHPPGGPVMGNQWAYVKDNDYNYDATISNGTWYNGSTYINLSAPGAEVNATAIGPSGYSQTKTVYATFNRKRGPYMIGGGPYGSAGTLLELTDTESVDLKTKEDPAIQPFNSVNVTDFLNQVAEQFIITSSYNLVATKPGTTYPYTPINRPFTGTRRMEFRCIASDTEAINNVQIILYKNGNQIASGTGVISGEFTVGDNFALGVSAPPWIATNPRFKPKRTFQVKSFKGPYNSTVEAWTDTFIVETNFPVVTPNNYGNPTFTGDDPNYTRTVVLPPSGTTLGLSVSALGNKAISYMRLEVPSGGSGSLSVTGKTPVTLGSFNNVWPVQNGDVVSINNITSAPQFGQSRTYRLYYGVGSDSNSTGSIAIVVTTRGQIYIPVLFEMSPDPLANMEPGVASISYSNTIVGVDNPLNITAQITGGIPDGTTGGWTIVLPNPATVSNGNSFNIRVTSPPGVFFGDAETTGRAKHYEKNITVTLSASNGQTKSDTFTARARPRNNVPNPTGGFFAVYDAPPGSAHTSNQITLTGFDGLINIAPTIITPATEAEMILTLPNGNIINTTESYLIAPGTKVALKTVADVDFSGYKTALLYNLTDGSNIETFTVFTIGPPTGGTFTNVTNANPGQTYSITSSPLSNYNTTFKYQFDSSSISLAYNNGWTLSLPANTTLPVGGASMTINIAPRANYFGASETGTSLTFTVILTALLPDGSDGPTATRTVTITTRPADQTIDNVSFTSLTDFVPGTKVVSNTVTLTGFDLIRTITVDQNSLLELNGDTVNLTATKQVVAGDSIKIHTTAPMDFTQTKIVTLTQTGTGSGTRGTFSITTKVCDDLGLLMDL